MKKGIDIYKEYERLRKMSKDELIELLYLQIRNIWRVDGLYFQEIEKRFGVDTAKEIDMNVWRILAKIEARDLKKKFNKNRVNKIEGFMNLLLNTSWAIYQENIAVEIDSENNVGTLKVIECKVQKARLKKGLGVFPCLPVRLGYLVEFAKEINPNINVEVISCPPHRIDNTYWCGWRFDIQ